MASAAAAVPAAVVGAGVMMDVNPEPVKAVAAVTLPSQCQWSPWGSHPKDSVGLGFRVAVLAPGTRGVV